MPAHAYDTDEALVSALQQGKEEAFTAIYRTYYQRVLWYARRYVRNSPSLEDITSETFMQLWKHRAELATMKAVTGFLHVCVRNKCYDLLRRQQMRSNRQVELLHLLEEEDTDDFYLEQLRIDLLHKIYLEVDKLPPKMREIFLLSYQEGLKPADIAHRLGLSVQTVSNQKASAIKVLKLALAGDSLSLSLLLLMEAHGLFLA